MRMVQEQRKEYPSLWAAVESLAPKVGCTPHTLLEWVRKYEIDNSTREGVTTEERERIKSLEREVKELRRANEIWKMLSWQPSNGWPGSTISDCFPQSAISLRQKLRPNIISDLPNRFPM